MLDYLRIFQKYLHEYNVRECLLDPNYYYVYRSWLNLNHFCYIVVDKDKIVIKHRDKNHKDSIRVQEILNNIKLE